MSIKGKRVLLFLYSIKVSGYGITAVVKEACVRTVIGTCVFKYGVLLKFLRTMDKLHYVH